MKVTIRLQDNVVVEFDNVIDIVCRGSWLCIEGADRTVIYPSHCVARVEHATVSV